MSLGDETPWSPRVQFNIHQGLGGYFVNATFIDDPAIGSGKTARQALWALANRMRQLANQIGEIVGS